MISSATARCRTKLAIMERFENAPLFELYGSTEAGIVGWCRARMATYKHPRSVSFLLETQMPRTATGTMQHRILRDRHLAAP